MKHILNWPSVFTGCLIALCSWLYIGCAEDKRPAMVDKNDPAKSENAIKIEKGKETVWHQVVDFGQGVYYFPYIRADFGNELSAFLRTHSNLEVSAVTGDIVRMNGTHLVQHSDLSYNADYGVAVGYFVIFREKK